MTIALLLALVTTARANEGVELVEFSAASSTTGTGWSCSSTTGCTITASGSYALSGPIDLGTSGASLSISGTAVAPLAVTLNLNGFAVVNRGSGKGIEADDVERLAIRNGFVSGGSNSLKLVGTTRTHIRLEDLDVQRSTLRAIDVVAGAGGMTCSGTNCRSTLRLRDVATLPISGSALRALGFGTVVIRDSHLVGSGSYVGDTVEVDSAALNVVESWTTGGAPGSGLGTSNAVVGIFRAQIEGGLELQDAPALTVHWTDVVGGSGIDLDDAYGLLVENRVAHSQIGIDITDPGSFLLRNFVHDTSTNVSLGDSRVFLVGNRGLDRTTACVGCAPPYLRTTNSL